MLIKVSNKGREANISLPDEVGIGTVLEEILLLLLVLGFTTDDIKNTIMHKALELTPRKVIEKDTGIILTKEEETNETKK